MKRIISTVLLLFAIATLSISAAALTAYDRQELSHVNALADQNPGFESGSVKWSGSPALTINSNAASQFVPGSKQFAVWDSNSASQEICSALVKVPESGNCAVSLTYKVPSGTATHKIVAKDGSKDLAVEDVVSSTAAWRHDVEFPCASAASNQARVCLRSVASNEPAIQLDGGYAGEARQVSKCGVDAPWVSYTPSITAISGTLTNYTVYGEWRRNGDSADYRFRLVFTGSVGTWAQPVFSMPSGQTVDTSKIPGGDITKYRAYSGGSLVDDSTGTGYQALGTIYTTTQLLVQSPSVTTHAGTAPLNPTGVNQVFPFAWASADEIRFEVFNVPIVGWEASQCVTPEQQGWFAAGYISGANPDLGTSSVSTYTEITNSSLTLTPDTGSAPIGIVCSSTNAAATPSTGATTCSAGSEGVGFATSVPRSGRYEVCMQFGHSTASSATDAGMVTAFEIVNTATNSQTILNRMGPRSTSGHYNNPATSVSKFTNVTACGQATLSAGANAFRLLYEQSSLGANAVSANVIHADANASIGDRAIRITMRPITTENQAILANSVISRDAVNNQVTTINTVVSKTTTYTATANDETILMSASGGAWTLALPPAASVRGKKYYLAINAASANAVTINPDGSETICGRATVAMLGNGDQMVIQSDGSNWVGLNNSCERRERARVVCNTPSSSISQQSTNWISTIGGISSGKCNLTFPSGICSTNPVLLAYPTQTSGNSWVVWSAAQTTTTTGDITGFTTSGSALGAFTAELSMTCAR